MKQFNSSSFMTLLAPFKKELVYVAVLSLITNLMMLVPTIYMLQLYDRVMLSHNTLTLIAVTMMVCFLLLMMALADWLRSTIVIKSGVRFDQTFGKKIFSLAFSNVASVHRQQPSQALADLTAVRQFISGSSLFAFFDVPWSVLYIVVLFVLNPALGLLAVVFCAIQFGLAVWNQSSSQQPLQNMAESQAKNSQFLQSKIRNLQTLHVMGMMPQLYQRWTGLKNNADLDEDLAQQRQNQNQFVNKLVRYSMQSLMLAVAAFLTIQGKISVGSMIASNVLIGRALQPFDVIVNTWRQYVQAKTAAASLNQLLLNKTSNSKSKTTVHQILGHISLSNVSVTFNNTSDSALSNLSLSIKPGRILNVMGASGSGKTTLARTLLGLITPQQGKLRIDEVLIQDIDAVHLAAAVGYLPQHVTLIEGTIAENIARFGSLDTEQIIAASMAVGMHGMILRMPQGYDTRIDEFGLPLSGGQRQLVGLARAIYQEPNIIVLDEPNASLDEFGEAHLLNILQMLKGKNKTIVVISHRSGLLRITDDLLILKSGEIAQYGPRDAGVAYLNQLQTLSMANSI
jgi:ATP-binding cassette subfamily C exporter for protease/lipase